MEMDEIRIAWLIGITIILCMSPYVFGSAHAWDFAAVGDVQCNDIGKSVGTKMKASPAILQILLGDVGYGDSDCTKKTAGFFKESGTPLLIANGNHDRCSTVAKYDKISGDRCAYGFIWKNVGFIIVNTQKSLSDQDGMIEGYMKKWTTNTEPKYQAIDFIVVAQHKPAVTNPSAHHGEDEAEGYREFYLEMGEKYPKFNLVLQGHNHGYQVCNPEGTDVTFITDGTGGRKPYKWGSEMDDNCHDNLSGSKYNGFSLFSVTSGDIQFRHVNLN